MRLGIVVNDIHTEWPGYTTTHLAMVATAMGHCVHYIDVGDFVLRRDDRMYAAARPVPPRSHRSDKVFLRELQDPRAVVEQICIDELDVMLLRNNPNDDAFTRPWARAAGIDFGLLAVQAGVIVLNDPAALARSLTKLYMHSFPEEVQPDTLVTRHRDEVKAFIADHGGRAVFKPLFGYGGRNVFLVRPSDGPNLNQMFETVAREGYVVVQEYLPAASRGDTRLFLMNGEPLRARGHVAAVARTRDPGDQDMRSNISAGGITEAAAVDDVMLGLAAAVRPRLVEDGIFLAGLDIVGDKIMEINIMTPGALRHAELIEGVSFSREIITAIERKVEIARDAPGRHTNVELATL